MSTGMVKKVSTNPPVLMAPAAAPWAPAGAVGLHPAAVAIARVYINKVANGCRDKHYSRKRCVNDGKVLLLRPNNKERKV